MFGIFESMIRILDTRFTASATQIFADFCGAKQHGDTICGLDRRIFCRGPCCDDLLLVSTTSTMSVVSFWFSPPLMRCLIHTARGSHPVVLSVAKCSSVSRDFAGVYFWYTRVVILSVCLSLFCKEGPENYGGISRESHLWRQTTRRVGNKSNTTRKMLILQKAQLRSLNCKTLEILWARFFYGFGIH